MYRILKTILILFLAFPIYSQHPCASYNRLITEARDAVDALEFEKAINKFNAAKVCDPTQEDEINDEILTVFNRINDLRLEAENSQKKAEKALRREKRAEQKARQQAIHALSDELTYKARSAKDRTIGFRLAEYAYQIDPGNPAALQELINRYYHDQTPWHTSLLGHEGEIYSIDWSENGKWIATGGEDNHVSIYNGETYQLLDTLAGFNGAISKVVFAPSGDFLATADVRGEIRLYYMEDMTEIYRERVTNQKITCLSFNPPTGMLGVGLENGTIVFPEFFLDEGNFIPALKISNAAVTGLEFSVTGSEFIATDWNGNFYNFETDSLTVLYQSNAEYYKHIINCDYGPDTRMAAICGPTLGNGIQVFDMLNKEPYFILSGHEEMVLSVKFSPDASKLVSTDEGGNIAVWDLLTKSYLLGLYGHTEKVVDATFSPDNTRLLTAGEDGSVLVWDLRTPTHSFPLATQRNTIQDAAISQNELYVATGTSDGNIVVYDQKTGQIVREFQAHDGAIIKIDFSSDGTKILSIDKDGIGSIWDLLTGEEVYRIETGSKGTEAKFSFINQYFGTACEDGQITVWDVLTQQIFPIEFGDSTVTGLDFGNRGLDLIGTNSAGELAVWDLESLEKIFEIEFPESPLSCATFSEDDRYFACGATNGKIRIFSMENPSEFSILEDMDSEILDIAFSPIEPLIAASYENGHVMVYDWKKGERLLDHFIGPEQMPHTLKFLDDSVSLFIGWAFINPSIYNIETSEIRWSNGIHKKHVYDVDINPNGKTFTSGGADGIIYKWDISKKEHINSRQHGDGGIRSVSYSKDGRYLVSGNNKGHVLIYDNESKELSSNIQNPESNITVTRFSKDQGSIFIGGVNNPISINDKYIGRTWDIASKKILATFEGHFDQILDAEFATKKDWVATASLDQTARIWNSQSGKVIHNLKHDHFVLDVDFSPNDKLLVTACADRIARVWDTNTGKILLNLTGHTNYVYAVAFSPDGNQIISSSGDGTAKIWDAKAGTLLYELRNNLPGPIKFVHYLPDSKSVLTASDTKAQSWLLNGDDILKEASELYQIDDLRATHLDLYKIIQYLEFSGNNYESLLNSENGRKMLHISNYLNLLGARTGRPEDAKPLMEKSSKLYSKGLENISEK